MFDNYDYRYLKNEKNIDFEILKKFQMFIITVTDEFKDIPISIKDISYQ